MKTARLYVACNSNGSANAGRLVVSAVVLVVGLVVVAVAAHRVVSAEILEYPLFSG